MIIYLLCFSISVLFAHFAKNAKQRLVFVFCSLVSVLLPSLLAGLRDMSIGIDTINYYEMPRYWLGAVGSRSLLDYLRMFLSSGNGTQEILFAVLLGVIQKTTGDFHVFLFVCHLIIVTGIYIGAFRMKKHAAPEITILLFFLLYYNHSLNITRQYIVMALIFAVLPDIKDHKLRYCIVVIITFFIHNTSVLSFIPLLIYFYLYSRETTPRGFLARKVFIVFFIIVFVGTFIPIVRRLIQLGVLSSRYYFFVKIDETYVPWLALLFLFVELVGVVLTWPQIKQYKELHPDFFLSSTVSFVALYIMSSRMLNGKRVAAYFSLINIVFLGRMIEVQQIKTNKRIVTVLIVGVSAFYWWYVYVLRNGSMTVPYVFGA